MTRHVRPITESEGYLFRFFRELVNCRGKRFRSTIDQIEVRRARSPGRARRAALCRFERRHKPFPWNSIAHGYECEPLPRREEASRRPG